MKLTKDQLEKLGIFHLNSKLKPLSYTIPSISLELNIYETTDMEDIYRAIREEGIEYGKELGRIEKIKEIKNVLNIES